MDKTEALKQIQRICSNIKDLDEQKFNSIENILKQYLEEHPTDTEMWLRLTMLEFNPPWEDPYRIEDYLKNILSYDPTNIKAVLTLAYQQWLHFGAITEETFETLFKLQTNDTEYLSMIEYAKALYFEARILHDGTHAENKYVYHLNKSIKYHNKHVNNYKELAEYYFKKSKHNEAKQYAQKALDNIQYVYPEFSEEEDITDIEEFFNYYYKGIHAMDWQKEKLKKIIKL